MKNIFCATAPFYHDFKHFYPDAGIISSEADIIKADMIIFTGGEDINPAYYGEKMVHMNGFNKRRDDIEEFIFRAAIQYKVPKLLGVCRGHQLICALSGGKLFQDISAQTKAGHAYKHDLTFLNNGGVIREFFTTVNSMHHQGVYYVPEYLIPTSVHGGVFESCQGRINDTKIFTVQFHPEFMQNTNNFFSHLLEM